MPQNDNFDMPAFKAHLDDIYHNRPTDITPLGLDLFAPQRHQINAAQSSQNAPQSNARGKSSNGIDRPEAGDKVAEAAKPADVDPDQAARTKLSQEALLANPTEMHKVFPPVQKGVNDTASWISGEADGNHLSFSNVFGNTTLGSDAITASV